MKLNHLLTGVGLFMALWCSGAATCSDSTQLDYQKYPIQAIKNADSLYLEATLTGDKPLLLKAVIQKNIAQLDIDQDAYPKIIKDVENRILLETDSIAKSILHTFAGDLYSKYYQSNGYSIGKRTSLGDYVPEDIREWSENLFKKKVFHHYLASVQAQTLLQQTPRINYARIIELGSSSDTLRPTLYDFLCFRAIDKLSQVYWTNRKSSPKPAIMASPQLFGEIDEFVALKIPSESLESSYQILKLYQDLLASLQKSGNQMGLLMANLDRLHYVRNVSTLANKDEQCLTALQAMEKKYEHTPMVVEVMAQEIQVLKWMDVPEKVKKILAICEKGIRKYPTYARINLLYLEQKSIFQPYIRMEYPKHVISGKEIELKVESKNTQNVTLTLFKINATTSQYEKWLRKNHSQVSEIKVSEQTYKLESSYLKQDTVFILPSVPNGLYRIDIKGQEFNRQLSSYFICSNLITTDQNTRIEKLFFVRDVRSGLPVANAKIRIYKNDGYRDFILLDSVYTDKIGYAKIKSQGDFYETVDERNPNGYITWLRGWSLNDNKKDGTSNLQLITDRQLYRPGQIVFFKGIAWYSSSDTLYPQKKQSHSVTFLDANGKVISQKQFTTNDFGSFAGQFTIPKNSRNGSFCLQSGDRVYIEVADYKRPEFDVILKSSESKYHFGDVIKIQGNVSSFSGVAASQQEVAYEITSHSFGRRGGNEIITNGITRTNEKGDFSLDFEAEKPSRNYRPWNITYYEVKTSVTDAKGETQSSTIFVPVFSGSTKPIVQIPVNVDKNKPTAFLFHLEGGEADVENTLNYKIHQLKTPTEICVSPEIKDTLIDKMVLEGSIRIQGNDSARITPDLSQCLSGAYLLTLENKGVTSKSVFFLYATRDKRPPIPTYDWLIEEKTECRPGEFATILFGTSARNAVVRCQIYSAKTLIRHSTHHVSDRVLRLDIPYLANYGSQIWLYLDYVKDGHYIQHTIPIKRFRENKTLVLETKVFRNKLLPGQKEQWEVCVKDQAGKPVNAEVLAMMYDASLDKISPYNIDFSPRYEQLSFPFPWKCDWDENERNYMSHYSESSWEDRYQIPPFQFDLLNVPLTAAELEGLDNFKYNSKYNFATFSDVNESSIIAAGATRKAQQNAPVDVRQNFEEVAFFYPQLESDPDGNVTIRFTVPESTTKWKFTALAQTKEMSVGKLTGYATTSRELMVRPNLPRFFRSGDRSELKAMISNLSNSRQKGKASICLFVPATKKVLREQTVDFDIAAGESQTVNFSFDVPQGIDLAGCRISAASGTFSDGEEHLVPVLPDKALVISTLPIYSSQKGSQAFTLSGKFPNPKDYYRLTLEMSSNPVWYALLSLPTYQEPQNESATDIAGAFYVNTVAAGIVNHNPKIAEILKNWMASPEGSQSLFSKLEQNSELKSVLLEASPWVMDAQSETERIQSLIELFNQDRLEYLQSSTLEKLRDLQTPTGGWSWFKNMHTSRFITCNILAMMSQASLVGEKEYQEPEKMMQMKALRYLDEEIKRDYEKQAKVIGYDQVVYLHVRSMYRDVPLGDALPAHKHFMALAQQQWARFSLYEKAILATAMQNYGLQEDARSIVKSLRQYAIITPEAGMYWPNNKNVYRNSALLTHTAIMEAFHTVEGNTPATDQMKRWLLNQKRVQNWGDVPSTVNAVYAILLSGSEELSTSEDLTVALGKKEVKIPVGNNPLGYVKWSVPAGEIETDMLTARVDKKTDTPTWGGMYFQYFEKFSEVGKESNGLQINKKLFVEQIAADGTTELIPIERTGLKVGNKVVVRLTLSLNQDMEYIHLKDLRAACFEPEGQISGNHWKFGTFYYQEVKDAITNFFFSSLAKGTYVIEYPVRVSQTGDYQNGIATLQSIYAPEFSARSNAERIHVANQ